MHKYNYVKRENICEFLVDDSLEALIILVILQTHKKNEPAN